MTPLPIIYSVTFYLIIHPYINLNIFLSFFLSYIFSSCLSYYHPAFLFPFLFFFFRCQGQERRISVTLRSTEGELGDLIVTVVAALTPVKVAKVFYFIFTVLCIAIYIQLCV